MRRKPTLQGQERLKRLIGQASKAALVDYIADSLGASGGEDEQIRSFIKSFGPVARRRGDDIPSPYVN